MMQLPKEQVKKYYKSSFLASFLIMMGVIGLIAWYFEVTLDDWPAIVIGAILADMMLSVPRFLRLITKKKKEGQWTGESANKGDRND